MNVLGGAPFGYRYIRKTPDSAARYEILEHEAVLVAEMFRRYADDGATIADLARWLTSQGVPTRTGKHRWDRSVLWGMLRNPAYAGRAVFGKTQVIHEQPGLNRVARLQGRTTPRPVKTVDRPREEWTEIAVPAIVDAGHLRPGAASGWPTTSGSPPAAARSPRCCRAWPPARPADTATTAATRPPQRATRSTTTGAWAATTTGTKAAGSAATSRSAPTTSTPSCWDHITGLLADPALIRAEIARRLEQARTSDPVTRQRTSSSWPWPRPPPRSPR